MSQTLNIPDLQLKLYEKLKPSGWADKLKTYVMSKDFEVILERLVKDVSENKRFTPELKYLFGAFESCPYKDVKVVWFGQDPYSEYGIPDGIAFSCSRTGRVEKSLSFMFKEIEDTVYANQGYTWDPDLSRWGKQGVLMLNTALTVTVGKPGTHLDLWRPFMAFLIDMLKAYNPGLIYVFSGNKAKELADYLDEKDEPFTLYTTHPASAGYQKLQKWDSWDVFNKINALTEKYYATKITW